MSLARCSVVAVTLAVAGTLAGQAPPAKPAFAEWLAELRQEAAARGISDATIERALGGLEPLAVVLERDRAQAEKVLPFEAYLKRRLDARTVRRARDAAQNHRSTLAKVAAAHGVPPGMLVAVWGLESTFGRFSGIRPTFAALATLAYDDRRSAMFRSELFDALQIVERRDIEIEKMKGSWAGAMGQPQFMPSSYLKYAVDFDGDGRKDIWSSRADTFASIANYLQQHGWRKGERWGREVRLPSNTDKVEVAAPLRLEGCAAERQMTIPLPLPEWHAQGVRAANGQALPRADISASLVRTGSRDFLVYANYEALLQYNCAHPYALSVALLADKM